MDDDPPATYHEAAKAPLSPGTGRSLRTRYTGNPDPRSILYGEDPTLA